LFWKCVFLILYKTKSDGIAGQPIYPFPTFLIQIFWFILQSEIRIYLDKHNYNFTFSRAKITFSIKLLHLKFGIRYRDILWRDTNTSHCFFLLEQQLLWCF
jgi:hypothetical protein